MGRGESKASGSKRGSKKGSKLNKPNIENPNLLEAARKGYSQGAAAGETVAETTKE